MCRCRRKLAKFGFDTAENEPCKVCPLSAYTIITDPPGGIPWDVSYDEMKLYGPYGTPMGPVHSHSDSRRAGHNPPAGFFNPGFGLALQKKKTGGAQIGLSQRRRNAARTRKPGITRKITNFGIILS